MAHVPLCNNPPDTIGLMAQWQDNGLSAAEREFIAAHVSQLNSGAFSTNAPWNASVTHCSAPARFMDVTQDDFTKDSAVRPLVKALLSMAGKVQENGKMITPEEAEAARQLGATDEMIHGTILIAAAFYMYYH